MKRYFFFILSITIFAVSCVKDRTQPVVGPVITPTSDTLMYFWNFNDDDSANHKPVFAVTAGASFKYYSSYIDYTTGSTINLPAGFTAGDCLRVRNPSDSIIFYMPTTGYDSISMSFAEQRSNSGPSQNVISYTVDGSNYISTALGNNAYQVDTTFGIHTFNFSSDTNVKHNPKFAVKIVFSNNNTGASGNDRFDNVSLSGVRK